VIYMTRHMTGYYQHGLANTYRMAHNTKTAIKRTFDIQKDHVLHWWEDVCGDLSPRWHPFVDLYEDTTHVVVEMDIPGVELKNMFVHIHDDMLTVRGNKLCVQDEIRDDYYMCERQQGKFSRQIRLPHKVETDTVQISDFFGTLRIVMRKQS